MTRRFQVWPARLGNDQIRCPKCGKDYVSALAASALTPIVDNRRNRYALDLDAGTPKDSRTP
jgi:hypothetical protein